MQFSYDLCVKVNHLLKIAKRLQANFGYLWN